MVSLPTFDNNVFSGPLTDRNLAALVDSPGKPLVNHLIAERYAPGSTFKTIVGAGALQEGVAAPWTTITSRGYITVENEFDPNVVYVYPDWAPAGRARLLWRRRDVLQRLLLLPRGRQVGRRVPRAR